MKSILNLSLVCFVCLGACSDATSPQMDAADLRDASIADVSVDQKSVSKPDAKPKTHDPAEFDCTKSGAPSRKNKLALDCVIDAACTTTMVTSHRGAGVDSINNFPVGRFAPENSLAAIRAAIAFGADAVEIDVRLSKDGQLVLMHDAAVDRTTKGKGKVDEMTLAELQALSFKSERFAGDFSCERVPTFDEVLVLTKARINIDVDVKSSAAVDKMALAIEKQGMIDQAFLSSGSLDTLKRARAAVAKIRLQARASSDSEIDAIFSTLTPPPSIVEIDEAILTAATIAKIHQKGAKVFVNAFTYDIRGYATDDPQGYAPLLGKKPDIVQTDRPDLVLDYLGRRP